jgi:hypothetical protein
MMSYARVQLSVESWAEVLWVTPPFDILRLGGQTKLDSAENVGRKTKHVGTRTGLPDEERRFPANLFRRWIRRSVVQCEMPE